LGIVEIIVILAVALIVIPPENLPDVMRATGKILRELRLASNMVVRELGGALDQPENHPPPINTMKPAAIASGATTASTAGRADSSAPATTTNTTTPAEVATPAAASGSAGTIDASSDAIAADEPAATTATSAPAPAAGPKAPA